MQTAREGSVTIVRSPQGRDRATGHEEGNAIVIRSLHSCTRAPSLSKRNWIVAIVARAHGVVLHTSRHRVSRSTEAAERKNKRT